MAYQLRYTYTYDDFVALILARRSLGPLGGLGRATPYVAVGVIYLVVMALLLTLDGVSPSALLTQETLLPALGGLAVLLLFVAVTNVVFLHLVYRPIFRRFALASKEIAVNLDDDGISWNGAGLTGHSIWANVRELVENTERLFLFISRIEAIVLPRRALASDQEFQALTTYARSRIHAR